MDERRAVELLRGMRPWLTSENQAAIDHAIATIERERWRPIAEAPEGEVVEVYTPDIGDGERHSFDAKDDGVWLDHAESYEHFVMVGGAGAAGPDCVCKGPSEQAPYTHWKRLTRPLPDPQPDGQVG